MRRRQSTRPGSKTMDQPQRWFLAWCRPAKPIWTCAEIGHKGIAISKQIKPEKNCFSKVSVDGESTRHRRQNTTHADMCTGSPSVWGAQWEVAEARPPECNHSGRHHPCEPQQEWRVMMESRWKARAKTAERFLLANPMMEWGEMWKRWISRDWQE